MAEAQKSDAFPYLILCNLCSLQLLAVLNRPLAAKQVEPSDALFGKKWISLLPEIIVRGAASFYRRAKRVRDRRADPWNGA